MEIGCENCGTRFELDESLLKAEGSKVRCSVCRHVFKAYPPEPEDMPQPEPGQVEPPKTAKPEPRVDLPSVGAPEEMPPADGFPRTDRAFTGMEDPGEYDFEKLPEESISGLEEEERERSAGREAGDEAFEGVKSLEPVPIEEERPAARKRSWKSRSWVGLLIVFLVLAGGAAVLHFLRSEEKKEPLDPGVRRLSFEAVSSGFVASREAGLLFVIRGMVQNNYPQARSHIRLKASVLDDRGQIVRQMLAYAGNTYTEEEIKALTLGDMAKTMENKDGMENANVNLAPGAAIPFMIVFGDFPDNLSEFTVEAVGSSPATP